MGTGAQRFQGNGAGAKQDGRISRDVDDGGLDATRTRARIENEGDAAIEGLEDMLSGGGRNRGGSIGAGSCKRQTARIEQRTSGRGRRNSHSDGVASSNDVIGNGTGTPFQDEGERSGPKGFG